MRVLCTPPPPMSSGEWGIKSHADAATFQSKKEEREKGLFPLFYRPETVPPKEHLYRPGGSNLYKL